MTKKNKAAQSLAKAKWAKISKAKRSAIMTKVIEARWAKKGAK
jgi:hypothetical protein